MIKRILFIILSILLGALFILSAYTKLFPVEPFEYTFVEMGISSWYLSPFFARLLIGVELFTGAMLILNLYMRFTCRFSILLLAAFTIYLTALIIANGNNGNCGCFGEFIVMTPMQAIIKNVVMAGLLFVLYRWHSGVRYVSYDKSLTALMFSLGFCLPFVLNPVELDYSRAYLSKPLNRELPLDSLYKHAELHEPPRTLSQGKHVIAFMSLRCPHCRIAAKKIRIIHERVPSVPFYLVLHGRAEDLKEFLDDTGVRSVPHTMLDRKTFMLLAGTRLPAIYLVNNSVVERELEYFSLDEEELVKWLNEDK